MAKGYLKTVLIYVQKVTEIMPEIAYLVATVAAVIEGKSTETQQILQKVTAIETAVRDLKTPIKTTAKTYAEALQGTKQPPETVQEKGKKAPGKAAGTPKTGQSTAVTDGGTVMILLKKGTEKPDFQGLQYRNDLNKTLKQPVVAKVSMTLRGNIALKLAPGYSVEDTLLQKDKIEEIFRNWPIRSIEAPTIWAKIVAHGVPVSGVAEPLGAYIATESPNLGQPEMQALKADIEAFNPVEIQG